MTEKLELWAIVELFGHQKMAGKVTEQSIGPSTFIRVSVPETDRQPAFDRLLNPSAIYAINPTTEEVARMKSQQLQSAPIEAWDIKAFQDKLLALGAGKAGQENKEEIEDDDDCPNCKKPHWMCDCN